MVLLKSTVCLLLIIPFAEVMGQDVLVPRNTLVVAGETATLRCQYHSTRCNQIRWQKNSTSGRITNISDGNRVSDGRYRLDNSTACKLVIDNVQAPDSGTFICTITGRRPGPADLIVLEAKPTCSSTCQNDSMLENERADFRCTVTFSGSRRPVMTWLDNQTGLEIPRVPAAFENRTSGTRDFSWSAVAPGFPPTVCLTKFYVGQTPDADGDVPEVRCIVASCNILSKPTCSSSCQNDSTVEKDKVDFKCAVKHSAGNRPVMIWLNKETGREVSQIPVGRQEKTSLSRNFSWYAVAPGFDPLTCLAKFAISQAAGEASKILEVECETDACNISYSVRNVEISPSGFASPGETIKCTADGNPEPSFEWQSKDGDGDWEDVKNETSETIEAFVSDGSSATTLRCVAKNNVSHVEYSQESPEVEVSESGATKRIAIIVGIIVGVVVVAIIAGVVYKFVLSG